MGLLAPVGISLLTGIAGGIGNKAGSSLFGKTTTATETNPGVSQFLDEFLKKTRTGVNNAGQGFYAGPTDLQRQVTGGATRSLNAIDPTDYYQKHILPGLNAALEGDTSGYKAIQDLFGQNRALALTQAKESAGSLGSVAGTGLARGIGNVVNESLVNEGVTLADVRSRDLDRRLTAAGVAPGILSGLPDIYKKYFDIGEADRQIQDTGLARALQAAMGLVGGSAQPQPRAYQQGAIEGVIPGFASLLSAYFSRPNQGKVATANSYVRPTGYQDSFPPGYGGNGGYG